MEPQTPNVPPITNQPTPYPPNPMAVPPAPAPPSQPVTNVAIGADSKIRSVKYLFRIFGATAVFIVIALLAAKIYAPLKFLSYAIAFVAIVMAVKATAQLKNKMNDVLAEEDKNKMVLLMSFDPLIGQAIYYYRLRKSMPNTAKIALNIGWKILGLQFALALVASMLFITLLVGSGVQTARWVQQYSAQLNTSINSINTNISNITAAARSNNEKGVQAGCEALKNDINNLKRLPRYPDKSIQQQIDSAISELSAGTDDCVNGIKNNDINLSSKAPTEVNNGINALNEATKQMSGNKR